MHTGCALEDIFSKSTVHSASGLEEDRNMKVSLAFPGCCLVEQHTEEKPIVYMLLELMILYCIEKNQTKPTMYSKQGKRWVRLCTSYTISGKEQTWSSAKCDSFHVRKAGPWVVTSPWVWTPNVCWGQLSIIHASLGFSWFYVFHRVLKYCCFKNRS